MGKNTVSYHDSRLGVDLHDNERNEKLRSILARHGFVPSQDLHTIRDAFALGSNALGGGLAAPETVFACEQKTRRCFFVRRSEDNQIQGFIALLYLNWTGYEALIRGYFNPPNPNLKHLTSQGEPAEALYVWCLAAEGDTAKRSLVRAVTEARRKAFPHIALFANPVSREGRMMTAALDAPSGPGAWLGWIPQKRTEESPETMVTDTKVLQDSDADG